MAASDLLRERRVEHVVLERDRIGESWPSKRWESLTLVTPAWTLKLPGFPYRGDPERFRPRDEIVKNLEDDADRFGAPARLGVHVESVRPRSDGPLEVATRQGTDIADNVVVGIGADQRPKIPTMALRLAPAILQLHASAYRHPHALPDGSVLVVGGGHSGAQIADEPREAGRGVYLSVGRCKGVPRREGGDRAVDLDATPGDPRA